MGELPVDDGKRGTERRLSNSQGRAEGVRAPVSRCVLEARQTVHETLPKATAGTAA